MPNVHIITNGDHWDIKVENGNVVGTQDTQADAERPGPSRTAAEKSSLTATKASSPESAKATPSKHEHQASS